MTGAGHSGFSMEIKHIEKVASTNTFLKENPEAVAPMTMLVAHEQFAGRGQRGNFWEADPGKNLTVSFRFKPAGLKPIEQFFISEAVALGIMDYLQGRGINAKVKWPNDIYVNDDKISGILIEHSILGTEITDTIVGIGLNVNQKEFKSDAPNPVSMTNLKGKEYSLDFEAESLGVCLEARLSCTENEAGREGLHKDYLDRLWRNDGRYHKFIDTQSGEIFLGKIMTVAPTGHLEIKRESGHTDRFAFKEVSFII